MKKIFITALLFGCFCQLTNACSCSFQESTDVEDYNDISALFTGRIVNIEEIGYSVIANFEVDIALKNVEKKDTISVVTGNGGGGDCGLYFRKDQYWIIWAWGGGSERPFSANSCGRSKMIRSEQKPLWINELIQISEFDGKNSWKYKNGSVGAIGRLKNGVPEGYWEYYYKCGEIKAKGRYKAGLKTGIWKHNASFQKWDNFYRDCTKNKVKRKLKIQFYTKKHFRKKNK